MVAFRLGRRAAALLGERDGEGLADDLAARRIDPYRAAEILLREVMASDGAATSPAGETDA